MEKTFNSLEIVYSDLLNKCSKLWLDVLHHGNHIESNEMRYIYGKMRLIHYKAEIAEAFIKIFTAAEEKKADLGEEASTCACFYFSDFIMDLSLESEESSDRFSDKRCLEFIGKWENLCGSYLKYFENVPLPKGINMDMYKFAVKLSEE